MGAAIGKPDFRVALPHWSKRVQEAVIGTLILALGGMVPALIIGVPGVTIRRSGSGGSCRCFFRERVDAGRSGRDCSSEERGRPASGGS